MASFSETIFKRTYAITPEETWEGCAKRVSSYIAALSKKDNERLEKDFYRVIAARKFIPGGRYLYSCGREIPQINNCFLLQAEDSREGWGNLVQKHILALSTGGGVGTEYSSIREKGAPIRRFGGTASGPLSLMAMVNEVARHVMAGGKRRSALWAGLSWKHPDVEDFIVAKNWPLSIRAFKEQDFNFPAPLDMTNISIGLDDDFFRMAKVSKEVWDLYYRICKRMLKTGEPGFSINLGDRSKEILRNPCTEVVSDTDSDCCNLGSINFGEINSIDELAEVTQIAVTFLFLGTHIGYLPHPDFYQVRERNHRIGLGLMGLHEWCLKNNQKYEASENLAQWLRTWKGSSDEQADTVAKMGIGSDIRPIAVRAIAPTGTISICAGTTSGIEPIFCVAYKRRYLDSNGKWKYSFVVDPTAERLIEQGVNPDSIEDAYSLATDVERRMAMQAFVQDYVDQGISSTINLPQWGEPGNNNAKQFAETLFKYLPKMRGVTVYPDGARSGQPLEAISYQEAIHHKNVVFEEDMNRCNGQVCGL
jgi:ribonucleoside-diphosphate reductase alpha chain